MSYIGLSAALGVAVDIPPIIRRLCMHPIHSDSLRNLIDAGPEVNDADSAVTEFKFSWWLPGQLHDVADAKYFNIQSAKECLEFHEAQRKDRGVEETTPLKEIFQKNYIFPSSAFGDVPVPPGKPPCTRCRLYRAVALGSQDKLRDLRNSLQGGRSLFRTETLISIRRASSFNLLYEAVVNKEETTTLPTGVTAAATPSTEPATGSKGKKRADVTEPATASKGKKRADVESWHTLSEERLKQSQLEHAQSLPSRKWVWGPDLTEEDLKSFVRGGDRNNVLPHTGYDESLDERSIGYPSPPVNIARFTQGGDPPFFELSPDIQEVSDLKPHQYPAFQFLAPQDYPLPFGQGPAAPNAEPGAGPGIVNTKGKKEAGAVGPVTPQPLLPLPPKDFVKLPDPITYKKNMPSELEGMCKRQIL